MREEHKTTTETQTRESIRPKSFMSFEDAKSYKALQSYLTLRGLRRTQ